MIMPADKAWIGLVAGAIFFELSSEDLLSHSTERFCVKHPILSRLIILAVAGHLGCVLPHHIDLFSAKNVIHRGIIFGCGKVKDFR